MISERVRLVIAEPAHAQAMLDYHVENREHLRPYEPLAPDACYTLEFRRTRLEQTYAEYQAGRAIHFLIELRSQPGVVIGVANFTNIVRGPFQACYLGYSIGRAYEGQGLMAEALSAALQYVFNEMHIHRVMANHLPDNKRSAALLKKLGFVTEGAAKNYVAINGEWRDHVLTSLTNPSWVPRAEEAAFFTT